MRVIHLTSFALIRSFLALSCSFGRKHHTAFPLLSAWLLSIRVQSSLIHPFILCQQFRHTVEM